MLNVVGVRMIKYSLMVRVIASDKILGPTTVLSSIMI